MLYNKTVGELQNDPDMWLEFLKFSAKVHKYSFHDQVSLFANNPKAELVADFDQWNNLGRRIIGGQKSIQIFDPQNNLTRNVFDVSQTWGRDFLVFNWELNDQDKENLIEHWNEKMAAFHTFDHLELDTKLQDVIGLALASKLPDDSNAYNCAAYLIKKRMGVRVATADEDAIRTALTGNYFDGLMASIHQSTKEVLLEIEKVLENKFNKERVLHHERIKRSITEPTLPRKPDWATVSSRRDFVQQTTRGRGGSFESVGGDRENVPDEIGGGKSRGGQTAEVRGEVLLRSEAERERGTRADRQPLHVALGGEPSTRDGSGKDSALPNPSPTSQGDNSSGIQVNHEPKSDAIIAPDFSFAPKTQTRQQLSLFDEVAPISTVIHELVEVDDVPMLETQIETAPVIEVENKDAFQVEVIETIDTIEVDEIAPISNFKFPEGDFYATSKRDKFQNNRDAILLLKELESTGRAVTASDQSVLARYVGWGGLSEAFDSKNGNWKAEYEALQELLSPEEYKAALDSVLTAYYTDPRLVAEIYHATEHFGIKPKKILDPAMGTGNFFSRLPEHLEEAKLYGVELDSITGRMAQKLYPDATIAVTGYEKMPFPDNSFDLVVGNIPFGDITMNDGRYGNYKFLIHDYFIAKSIDVVKDDGVVATVTSKGTLDKKDDQVRRYLAERADLVGAFRLPNNAFTAIAGTSVTSDVLFFQKRAELRDLSVDMPRWVQTQPFENSQTTINQYFLDHPHHVLGELELSSIYGPQSALVCKPRENQDLYKDFRQALIGEAPDDLDVLFKELQTADDLEKIVPEGTRNNTYFVHQDKLYYKTFHGVEETTLSQKTTQRLTAMCNVRHHLMAVINTQLEVDYDTSVFQKALAKLNQSYDDFVKQYGYFNDKTNRNTFSNDDQLPLLLSIEKKSKEDKSISKGDIFFKPTIRPTETITHVETAHDALIVSLSKKLKVDLDFMESISDFSKDELTRELDGMIFQDPTPLEDGNTIWRHRDEYLSGDVKEKLVEAIEASELNPEIDVSKNIAALEGVMPEPLKASEIEFQLGSTWIPMSVYQDFMHEIFETAFYNKKSITIEHCKYSGRWYINSKNDEYGNIKVNNTYGTERINAYAILEKTLNLGQINIKDKIRNPDGNETLVLNVEATMVARAKQDLIKQKFASWLFEEPSRASELVGIYNEKFNRFVPRNYNGSHLEFPNLSTTWKLRPHQENVAARILYNRSALTAHEVGAGKTASMIVAGMTLKQQGAVHKPLYVVPSDLIEQFACEFMSMYPTANVLMTTKKDFKKKNRHQFVSKIATNDYDAIIIGHSQFEKIPLSAELEESFLQSQLDDITDSLENTTADEKSWSVKSMVRFKLKLEDKLSHLRNQERKDNVINFEQLGIDFMFVDEAHIYKNLLTVTKLENVAGISTSSSQRAMDMFLKCRYIQEKNNGGNIVFATGTPISNSMSELYIMMRFLQNDLLKSMGIASFDAWASTFGEITSSLEMTPEGSGYRIRNRFAKFHNLPELMSMFQLVADIQTHDMLNLPTPDLHGGKAQIIISEPSAYQRDMMADLADRAERIRTGNVDPRADNMLKITHEAKLMAIDPRLLDPDAPIDEGAKLFRCANNVHRIWEDTAEQKSAQIVFCDSGTPKKDQFNVYHEIKRQLIEKGIPEAEIAFIHDGATRSCI